MNEFCLVLPQLQHPSSFGEPKLGECDLVPLPLNVGGSILNPGISANGELGLVSYFGIIAAQLNKVLDLYFFLQLEEGVVVGAFLEEDVLPWNVEVFNLVVVLQWSRWGEVELEVEVELVSFLVVEVVGSSEEEVGGDEGG